MRGSDCDTGVPRHDQRSRGLRLRVQLLLGNVRPGRQTGIIQKG